MARMAPFATIATRLPPLARAAGCARRALSTATLGRETDAADFWRRSQDGVVLPELSAQLEAPTMSEASWPGLRPAVSLEAASSARQIMPQAAPSLGQPRPVGR
eukprot:scaffold63452_cov65-Phaeocystis_antarctica.AAC.8